MPRGVFIRTPEYRAKMAVASAGHQLGDEGRRKVAEARTVHGMRRTPTYRSWEAMKRRCKVHPLYAGQGITVCDRWQSFASFLADMGVRPAGMTLDRIDNDGNYEPGNVRWATKSEQALNRGSHGFAARSWRPYGTEVA